MGNDLAKNKRIVMLEEEAKKFQIKRKIFSTRGISDLFVFDRIPGDDEWYDLKVEEDKNLSTNDKPSPEQLEFIRLMGRVVTVSAGMHSLFAGQHNKVVIEPAPQEETIFPQNTASNVLGPVGIERGFLFVRNDRPGFPNRTRDRMYEWFNCRGYHQECKGLSAEVMKLTVTKKED